jgi:cell volume regulation protein A
MDPSVILFVGGLIIVLGFVTEYLFRKTGVSNIIFLLFFGLFLASTIGIAERGILVTAAPLFSIVALIIILIDGGLSINLYDALRGSFRATLLAVVGFIFSMLTVAAIALFLFDWNLAYGLLLGSIVGPTGSVVVITLVNRLKMDSSISTVLKLETAMNDVIAIVVALALLNSLVLGGIGAPLILRDVIAKFSIGGMIGLMGGVFWYLALEKLRGQQFSYMLTLAVAFIVFSAVENVGGSGPVSVLFLGLALGNEESISYILKKEKRDIVFDSTMKGFHSEISFFVQTFFFVYLGLIVSISDYMNVVYGIMISIALVVARLAAVGACTIRSTLKKNRGFIALMLPKGLSTAVMAVFVISYASKYPDRISASIAQTISDITFVVIVVTIAIATVGAYIYSRKNRELQAETAAVPVEK